MSIVEGQGKSDLYFHIDLHVCAKTKFVRCASCKWVQCVSTWLHVAFKLGNSSNVRNCQSVSLQLSIADMLKENILYKVNFFKIGALFIFYYILTKGACCCMIVVY